MARPHKRTVDYFPHDTDASDGKTLTIIQSKYGNDGYSFWFKMLQLLGRTPGHYYDFNNPAAWEFLLAKTHLSDIEKVKGILETLVVLDAIDAELYAHGVIWCQKFVDRVADAYNRTVDGAPKRPDFLVNVGNRDVSVPDNRVSTDRNPENITGIPQTKLKETKLKGSKYILYSEFPNIKMAEDEHQKLLDQFGIEGTRSKVEALSLYIASRGDKYKNHYATILNWERRAQNDIKGRTVSSSDALGGLKIEE